MRITNLIASFLLSIVCLSGCQSSEVYDLDDKWDPLEQICERPNVPGTSSGTITTIGDTVYVADLDRFLQRNPVDSTEFNSILKHEQVHSIRQLYTLGCINTSRIRTSWAEEQLGWYEEIRLKRRLGRINVDAVARTLSNYQGPAGRMVSFDEAKAWVQDVLAGRWRPPE